jgi:hypothetical protein
VSTLNLSTREFVGLLTDTTLTAGQDMEYFPALATVLLDTDRGEVTVTELSEDGNEPLIDVIESDVLVGTSTNGASMIGQAHTACEGQLHRPVLISAVDARMIYTALKEKSRAPRVELELSGDSLTVSEMQKSPGRLVVSVPSMDLENYPRTVASLMCPDRFLAVVDGQGQVIEPSYGTGMSGEVFEVVGKISKRRKMVPSFYRHHHRRGVVVEVGWMWRGLFMPTRLDEENGQHLEPQVRVFVPRLPDEQDEVQTQPLVGVVP